MVRRTVHILSTVAIVSLLALGTAGSASAEERYTDEDSNYVKVASRVLQPVGLILEAVIFKPFTALTSWSDPPVEHEVAVTRPTLCYGQRPHAACSSKRW